MDSINKALKKFTKKEREFVAEIVSSLIKGNTKNLNLRKLKGLSDIYRVRKGKIRVVYRKKDSDIYILIIDRRKEDTYKF